MVMTDLDCHLPVKPFQKIEQFVRCEAAEMPIHQMRHVGLRDTQDAGDFPLFQLLLFEDLEDVISDLRPRQQSVRVFEA